MRVLVAGNSQAGALRRAMDKDLLKGEQVIRPDFYVVPGGQGPTLTLKEGKIEVTKLDPKHLPYMIPPEVGERRVNEYDAILISALGYVGGGRLAEGRILMQGYVADFIPRKDRPERPLISRTCLTDIMRPALMRQPGFIFLKELRKQFRGMIMVQPFPYPSEGLIKHEDWKTRTLYEDFLGFNRFLFGLRDSAMSDICADLGVDLLGPPDPSWSDQAFTPRNLMDDRDGLHTGGAYGAMVLRQVTEHLGKA